MPLVGSGTIDVLVLGAERRTHPKAVTVADMLHNVVNCLGLVLLRLVWIPS